MARRGGHHVSHHRHRHSRGGARVQAAHRLELKGDHTVDQTFKGGGRARWAQRHAERPTPRPKQLLVLERMTKGESNKQIAYNLDIAETTVKAHVSAILRKLGVHNRVQAILSAGDIDFSAYLRR